MDYKIREIKESEHSVLSDFLYEAIFIPKGMEKPPKSIIEQPELQEYLIEHQQFNKYTLSDKSPPARRAHITECPFRYTLSDT